MHSVEVRIKFLRDHKIIDGVSQFTVLATQLASFKIEGGVPRVGTQPGRERGDALMEVAMGGGHEWRQSNEQGGKQLHPG